jgi:hypothetical protein
MNMTHYMELLAVNQPWNLILFMGIPVVLAETVAVTELYLLYTRNYASPIRTLNRLAGLLVGVYFAGIFVYLLQGAVVPLTQGGGWRGWIDVMAVAFYLLGVIPLGAIALLEMNVLGRGQDEHRKMLTHAAMVGLFLIVAHIAMIFGMMDPTLGGYQPAPMAMEHGGH